MLLKQISTILSCYGKFTDVITCHFKHYIRQLNRKVRAKILSSYSVNGQGRVSQEYHNSYKKPATLQAGSVPKELSCLVVLPQRLNRILASGTNGWVEAKGEANRQRQANCHHRRLPL